MIKVIMDIREDAERRDAISLLMDTTKDIVTEEGMLNVADYLVMKDDKLMFAVEWKTFNDMISSIQNGHLKSQLQDMEGYECPTYLIVTGNYKSWISKAKKLGIHFTKSNINGFITSVAGRYKTKLIMYDTEKEGYLGLLKLISIHKEEGGYDYKIPERVKYTGDIHTDMMLAIPGLGMKTVKDIRKEYKFCEFIESVKTDTCSIKIKKPIMEYIKKL